MRLSEQGTTAELKKLTIKYYDALYELKELQGEIKRLTAELEALNEENKQLNLLTTKEDE